MITSSRGIPPNVSQVLGVILVYMEISSGVNLFHLRHKPDYVICHMCPPFPLAICDVFILALEHNPSQHTVTTAKLNLHKVLSKRREGVKKKAPRRHTAEATEDGRTFPQEKQPEKL